jgi:hypothetical protein
MKATLYDLTDGRLAKPRELLRLRSRPGRLMGVIAWQAAALRMNFALRLRTHAGRRFTRAFAAYLRLASSGCCRGCNCRSINCFEHFRFRS